MTIKNAHSISELQQQVQQAFCLEANDLSPTVHMLQQFGSFVHVFVHRVALFALLIETFGA